MEVPVEDEPPALPSKAVAVDKISIGVNDVVDRCATDDAVPVPPAISSGLTAIWDSARNALQSTKVSRGGEAQERRNKEDRNGKNDRGERKLILCCCIQQSCQSGIESLLPAPLDMNAARLSLTQSYSGKRPFRSRSIDLLHR